MASSNIDWRTFGGNKNYEKNNNGSFYNLITDNLIVKNPYDGLFSNVSISENLNVSQNTYIAGDIDVSGIMKVTGTLSLDNNVNIDNNLYVNGSVNIGLSNELIILKSKNRNLGVNVLIPTATIDVSGNTINTLKLKTSLKENVNVISIDCSNDGITVLTDGSKNAIQFWNKTKIPFIPGGNELDNRTILNNTTADASITYYPAGGNITIDCSNNTYINSSVTIGSGPGGTATIPHRLNETALITDVSFSQYLANYYGVSSNNYQTGNALTLVSGSNLPSNVGLNLVTNDIKGMSINGGDYVKDFNRSAGTISIFDVCGAIYPVQVTVSGNNPAYLKATTGFNTLAPQTEKYTMCVNGPVKITNDEIQTIMDVDFRINCVVNSQSIVLAAGSNKPNSDNNKPIMYSLNGGESWKTSNYTDLTEALITAGFIYDSRYFFLSGDQSLLLFSKDKGDTWSNIQPGLTIDFTDILVLPHVSDNLILLGGTYTNTGRLYWSIVNNLDNLPTIDFDDNEINFSSPINCIGAIPFSDNNNGILYVAGKGIESLTISTTGVTSSGSNTINPDYTYNALDISSSLAVFAGNGVITYKLNPIT